MDPFTDEIRKKFRQAASEESTITCSQCLAIARELGIPMNRIGEMLTKMNIKIINCQLGCFP